jgi:hypothetical protein
MRWLSKITWVLAVTPVIFLLVAVSLALHVRLGLGHWPEFGEHYRTSVFHFHEGVLVVFGFLAMSSVALWLLALCFKPLQISVTAHIIQAFVYAGGWGLVVLFWNGNPWGVVNWYFD